VRAATLRQLGFVLIHDQGNHFNPMIDKRLGQFNYHLTLLDFYKLSFDLHKNPLNGEWKIENGKLVGMRAFPGGLHDGNQQFDQFFVIHADGGKALVGEVFGASEG
jgi:hypothetical protein